MKALYGIMTCSVFVATLTPRRPVALACTGHGSTRQLYQFKCTVRLVSASLYCHFSMFCVSYWVFFPAVASLHHNNTGQQKAKKSKSLDHFFIFVGQLRDLFHASYII